MSIFKNFANLRDDKRYFYIASIFLSMVPRKVDYAFSCYLPFLFLPLNCLIVSTFLFEKKNCPYWFVGRVVTLWWCRHLLLVYCFSLKFVYGIVCLRDVLNLWVVKSVTFPFMFYISCVLFRKTFSKFIKLLS